MMHFLLYKEVSFYRDVKSGNKHQEVTTATLRNRYLTR